MNDYTRQLVEADKKYLWHPFTQMQGWLEGDPVIIESGEGFWLVDTEGKRYIDGFSSLWCNVHGHRVEKIDKAICRQVGRISHSTLLGLGQTRSIELAEKLVEITPGRLEKVFYSDSGATAVEIAVKMAYQYQQNMGAKKRTKFVSLANSYHGDTIGSVSVGGIGLFHGIFRSLLFETFYVPSPHPYRFDGTAEQCCWFSLGKMEEILKQFGDEIAAIIVEPLVQGAAGILVHPSGFLKGVQQLAEKYGVLLIVDEVATGFGRTGKMFACEHEGVEPDLMCLAKGITGGYLPVAATMSRQSVFDAFLGQASDHRTFYHGHTYTGNALGCAAGIASLELFEENDIIASMDEKVEIISEYFSRIRELAYVGDARQCGLMGAVEIVKDKSEKKSFDSSELIGAKVCMAMRRRGAMLRPLADTIVIMPPVAIDCKLLRKLLEIVYEVLKYELTGIIEG